MGNLIRSYTIFNIKYFNMSYIFCCCYYYLCYVCNFYTMYEETFELRLLKFGPNSFIVKDNTSRVKRDCMIVL